MRLQALTTLFLFSAIGYAFDKAALLESYRAIQADLAYDRYSHVRAGATRLVPALDQWIAEAPTGEDTPNVTKMREGAVLLSETSEEAEQRRRFSILAEGALRIIKRDTVISRDWQLYKCTMVDYFPYWSQPKAEKMANPYMGTQMLQCGVKKAWTALP